MFNEQYICLCNNIFEQYICMCVLWRSVFLWLEIKTSGRDATLTLQIQSRPTRACFPSLPSLSLPSSLLLSQKRTSALFQKERRKMRRMIIERMSIYNLLIAIIFFVPAMPARLADHGLIGHSQQAKAFAPQQQASAFAPLFYSRLLFSRAAAQRRAACTRHRVRLAALWGASQYVRLVDRPDGFDLETVKVCIPSRERNVNVTLMATIHLGERCYFEKMQARPVYI